MATNPSYVTGGGNALSSALIQSAGKADLAPQKLTEAKRLVKDNHLSINSKGEVTNFNEWQSTIHAAAQVLESQSFLLDKNSSMMLTEVGDIDAAVEFINHRNTVIALEKQVGSTQVSAILNGKMTTPSTIGAASATGVVQPAPLISGSLTTPKPKKGGLKNSETPATPTSYAGVASGTGHGTTASTPDSTTPSDPYATGSSTSSSTTGQVQQQIAQSGGASTGTTTITGSSNVYTKFLNLVKKNAPTHLGSVSNMHGRKIVYFLDTSFRVEQARVTASELLEFEEVLGSKFFPRFFGHDLYYIPLESRYKAAHRQALFSLLEDSISKAITRTETKNIAHNDCYALFTYVVERFGIDRKEERHNTYYESFQNLTKIDTTSFDKWHSQHQAFIKEGTELNGLLPDFFLRTHIRLAVYKSNNRNLKSAWTETARRFREREREVDKGTNRYTTNDISLEAFFLSLRDDYQTRNYYVNQKTDDKPKSDKPTSTPRVNSVGTGSSDRTKKKSPCVNFNEGKCTRDDCMFEHKKLDEKELKKLKENIEKVRVKKKNARLNKINASMDDKPDKQKDD